MDFKERQMRLPDVRIEAAEMIIASGMVPDSRVSSALFPVEIKTISKPFFRRAGANTEVECRKKRILFSTSATDRELKDRGWLVIYYSRQMEDCAVPKQGKPFVHMDFDLFYRRKRFLLLYH